MSQINTYYSDLLSEKDHNVNKRQFTHISSHFTVHRCYVTNVCTVCLFTFSFQNRRKTVCLHSLVFRMNYF